jgi:heat-inducible transcriptional repressor
MQKLDDRKKKILKAVVDEYIETAEPIGSGKIAKHSELGVSPATIRNEMANLEDMGYLRQPHTSAGRVPSDSGYRYYVDELMKMKKLTHIEIENIKRELETKYNEINQLMRRASYVLSKHTKYTSMSMAKQHRKSLLKAVQVGAA